MLLLFPNTFEYFFIAYELVRLRFEPSRISARFWLLAAAGLWVFVKLPQEYWIHVAQAGLHRHASRLPGVRAGDRARAARRGVRARPRRATRGCPRPTGRGGSAADRLPSSLAEAHARYARRLESGRVLTREAFEKVCLLGLLCIIFASILPGIDATILQVVVGVTAVVLVNAAISLAAARRGGFGVESAAGRLRGAARGELRARLPRQRAARRRRTFDLGYGIFFAFLMTTHDLAVRHVPTRVRPALRIASGVSYVYA